LIDAYFLFFLIAIFVLYWRLLFREIILDGSISAGENNGIMLSRGRPCC
jgi:hypothetical protein